MTTHLPLNRLMSCFIRCVAAILLFVTIPNAFSEQTDKFGGPYAIGGHEYPDVNLAQTKVAEFNAYVAEKWGYSQATKLTFNLLQTSIQKNAISKVPYANRYQRYNYVVLKKKDGQGDEIVVATWAERSRLTTMCNISQPLPKPYDTVEAEEGVMVNFFPEDPNIPLDNKKPSMVSRSPCEIKSPLAEGGSRNIGFLDANSKHFMLAQGLNKQLKNYIPTSTISGLPDLAEVRAHHWVKRRVLYAGEIIVDVKGCHYFINQGSGTYRPKSGGKLKILRDVATFFEDELGLPPSLIWTQDQDGHVQAWPIPMKNKHKSMTCVK